MGEGGHEGVRFEGGCGGGEEGVNVGGERGEKVGDEGRRGIGGGEVKG
ncbi:hypothetical protein Pmani_035503, partial [Petrolisthes manimaculis]